MFFEHLPKTKNTSDETVFDAIILSKSSIFLSEYSIPSFISSRSFYSQFSTFMAEMRLSISFYVSKSRG